MTIEAIFINRELAGVLRDGAYELPDGSTVTTLMDAAQLEAGVELTDDQKTSVVFVLDNKPAGYDTKLSDGTTLRAMYKIMGG